MATRAQIVAAARAYVGTPFRHQGRLRGIALDCVGLPICVGRDLGLKIPDYANYEPYPFDDLVLRECKKHLTEIARDSIRPGDIIVFRVPIPRHVGIASDLPPGLGVIHALEDCGKVAEHSLVGPWIGRIAGVFLFPGVED